jgi:hypothetical protein
MSDWLHAFLLTEAIEGPIYLVLARHLPWPRRLALAFGASAITHPLVWLLVLSGWAPYEVLVLTAELFAIATEAWYARRLGVQRAWETSLVANLASFLLGLALR